MRQANLSRSRPSLMVWILLAAALLLMAGCKIGPIDDTSPANLDIVAIVTESPLGQGTTTVVMGFQHDGEAIRLVEGEKMNCNGVDLENTGVFHGGQVPRPLDGASYDCVYNHSGVPVLVSLPTTWRPVFVDPSEGATLNRGDELILEYEPGGGEWVKAEIKNQEPPGAQGDEQPDSGLYAGLDTSGFAPGPGRIGLLRKVETHLDTDFRTFKLTLSASSGIDVTWR